MHYLGIGCVFLLVMSFGLLHPATIGAIPPPGNDLLGIYTTDDGMGIAHHDIQQGMFTAYLCITGCTEPSGVSGWECRVVLEGDAYLIGMLVYGGAIVLPVEVPYIIVGLNEPQLPDRYGLVPLAAIDFFVIDSGEAFIYLKRTGYPTPPGTMAYWRGNDPDSHVELGWSSGAEDLPVFGINTGSLTPPIPVARETWGSVKLLYR